MGLAIKETIVAGNLIFNKVTTKKKNRLKGGRKKKFQPTSISVEKLNQYYSEKDLNIKLHHNFKPGDLHIVFTYSGKEPTKEEAKKKLKKLKRDLAKLYKKHGQVLKWIEATEYENKRIHHHMVISYIEPSLIQEIWQSGYIRSSYLDHTGDWRKLSSYIIKETSKTFRLDEGFSKKRFRCSRTIANPNVKIEEVSTLQLIEPRATRGYYIDKNSIFQGVNPETNKPYVEFIQISLAQPLAAYRKGRKRKYKKEHVKNIEAQLNIDYSAYFEMEKNIERM